jgi:uncharacterized membrane protein
MSIARALYLLACVGCALFAAAVLTFSAWFMPDVVARPPDTGTTTVPMDFTPNTPPGTHQEATP